MEGKIRPWERSFHEFVAKEKALSKQWQNLRAVREVSVSKNISQYRVSATKVVGGSWLDRMTHWATGSRSLLFPVELRLHVSFGAVLVISLDLVAWLLLNERLGFVCWLLQLSLSFV